MTDQELRCIRCTVPFTFTVGEQQFYAEKGFVPPKRCPACREEFRGRRRDAQASADARYHDPPPQGSVGR